MQMCYLVRIPEYDEALEFYIVKKNFRVDVDLETAFKSEERMVMPVTIPPPVDDARASLDNWIFCGVKLPVVGSNFLVNS